MRSVDDEKVKQQTKILVKTENRRWIAETLDCQQNSKGKKKSNLYGKRHRHFTAAIALTRMKALPLCMPLITNSNIDKPSRREIKKKKTNNNRRTSTETYMCIKKKKSTHLYNSIYRNKSMGDVWQWLWLCLKTDYQPIQAVIYRCRSHKSKDLWFSASHWRVISQHSLARWTSDSVRHV